jgi:CheY-like chemotaxis protein
LAIKRALVIDEDVEARRILRDILRTADWAVDDAPGGVEALGLISQARAYGEGYHCIFTELFLPDLDGSLFLETLRLQYPDLPLAVISAFATEEDREGIARLNPVYLGGRPVDEKELLAVLDKLELTRSTYTVMPPEPSAASEPPVGAYLFVSFESFDAAQRLYGELGGLDGVISVNAVKGEGIDLVMRVGATNVEGIVTLAERVEQIDGITSVRHELIVKPPLGVDLQEFVEHYLTLASQLHADYVRGVATNAYLIIDIDRYQLERIYLSILLTEGVIRCRVISGFNKLMVLSAGAVRPNVVRHLLAKLAQLDGIRRVREVTVVNMNE